MNKECMNKIFPLPVYFKTYLVTLIFTKKKNQSDSNLQVLYKLSYKTILM